MVVPLRFYFQKNVTCVDVSKAQCSSVQTWYTLQVYEAVKFVCKSILRFQCNKSKLNMISVVECCSQAHVLFMNMQPMVYKHVYDKSKEVLFFSLPRTFSVRLSC